LAGKTKDPPAKADVESHASTAVPSLIPSNHQAENEKNTRDDLGDSSQLSGLQKEVEAAAPEDVDPAKPTATEKEDEKQREEEEIVYPTGMPLMIVVVGLCLSVLLVALVS